MTSKLNIYQRIAKVTAAIGVFEKNGYNAHHKYKFAGIESVVAQIQPLCIEHGICLIQEAVDGCMVSNGDKILSVCVVVTSAINVDDPDDRHITKTIAHGWDSTDKGIYKANSGGRKYAIFGMFNLHAGEDDPEYTSDKPQKRTERPSGAPQATKAQKTPKASGGLAKLRLVLFPGLSGWPPMQYKDGQETPYAIKLATPDPKNPKMAWAGKPTKAGGAIAGMSTDRGFDSTEHRYSLIKALYKAFEVDGPASTKEMNGGQGAFICNCLEHPNIIRKSIADDPPWMRKETPPDDVELDPDLDLEDDNEFFND